MSSPPSEDDERVTPAAARNAERLAGVVDDAAEAAGESQDPAAYAAMLAHYLEQSGD